ncbi:recombinase family protein [Metabacillus litoralis]|uniref:recombinase family protein n=1 Tax=Metabacillus litoralis TaxID=152268 RepID=UPI001E35CCDD|nr:recombinase family protein [Metabacillus litoralis]UHA60642.1 recombinase family protein [Metabacillus litoralis]
MRERVAVGYARSSGSVNPASSIPNQILSMEEYCEKQNIYLKEIYVDERKTGTKVDGRNEYKLLMKQLQYQSDIELVLVAFFDRLGRESYELIQAVEEIRVLKKELVCIKEDLSSKSLTPLQLSMMAIQAENENMQRTRRLADSKNSKIQKGKYLLGGVPYGYILDDNKMLVKDPVKSLIVAQIFYLYRQEKLLVI